MGKWWPWHRSHAEAAEGVARAERDLEQVRGRWPAVRRAAELMDEHRERNGFAEAIRAAMGSREQ